MNEPLVTLRGVGVSYDGKPALTDIDLEIRTNDFIGIVGPNGGGKTTLVKAILGLVPHTGEIRMAAPLRTEQGRIGYLPQQSHIDTAFPILTEEVIASGLQSGRRLMGRIRPQERLHIAELMETTGITHLRGKAIGTLSGGEMQRVFLCRALISGPALLILDEPSNFVDPQFEHELYELLRTLSRRMAIVMVSHNRNVTADYADRLYYVDHTIRPYTPEK